MGFGAAAAPPTMSRHLSLRWCWWQHRSSAGLGWLERTGPGLGRAHSRAGPRTPANTDTTSLASFDKHYVHIVQACIVIIVGACVYNRNSERKLSDRVDGI